MDSITETVIRNITEIRSHQESALVPVTGQSRLADIPLDKAQEAELRLRLEKEYGIRLSQPLPCTVGEIAEAVRSCCEEKKRKARRIITIPNLLSLFRLLLIPVYAMLYVHAETAKDYLLSGAILALSCITDLFDGLIARRFDQISNLGKALDPIADKATQGVMLLCVARQAPPIMVALWIFRLKEGFQLVMGCWYPQKGTNAARRADVRQGQHRRVISLHDSACDLPWNARMGRHSAADSLRIFYGSFVCIIY